MMFMCSMHSGPAKLHWIGRIGKFLESPFNFKPASKVLFRRPTKWLLIEVNIWIMNSPKRFELLGPAFETTHESCFRLSRVLSLPGELCALKSSVALVARLRLIPQFDNGLLLHLYQRFECAI